MSINKLLQKIDLCSECEVCLETCPVYKAAPKEEFSPLARLKAAKKIFLKEEIAPQMIESIYSCLKCCLCSSICPQGIDIPNIVHEARVSLAERGLGPLKKHQKVIAGIQKLGNSVNGDPSKRVAWLPEEFPKKESDTLFFVGCLPSYLVQECARSSYLLLKKLDIDFMLLQDEGCCGVYFYDSGRVDLAQETFEQNAERFKKLGIKKLIVSCAGCYRCFKRYYPRLLNQVDFEIFHITEVLFSLLQEKKIKPKTSGLEVTYQDPCRLGRMEKLYHEPRKLLELCGVTIQEMPQYKEKAFCCGAGAGIRSVYPAISLKLSTTLLDQAPVSPVITSCPFCAFNLNYASKKTARDKEIIYITTLLDTLLPPPKK